MHTNKLTGLSSVRTRRNKFLELHRPIYHTLRFFCCSAVTARLSANPTQIRSMDDAASEYRFQSLRYSSIPRFLRPTASTTCRCYSEERRSGRDQRPSHPFPDIRIPAGMDRHKTSRPSDSGFREARHVCSDDVSEVSLSTRVASVTNWTVWGQSASSPPVAVFPVA